MKRPAPRALYTGASPPGVSIHKVTDRESWLALRGRDVTASAAAALFGDGAHPYVTALKLWAEKSGRLAPEGDTRTMRRGRLMEPVILQMLREDYPDWGFIQADRYYREDEERIGATPDFFCVHPAREGFGVIDAKSVGKFAWRKGWLDELGEVRVPAHILIQVSVTAALCGASYGLVAPCQMGDGGFDLTLEEVPLRPGVMPALRKLTREFWRRVDEADPYPPDYKRDAALVAALYQGEGGPVIDLGDAPEIGRLLDDRATLKERESDGAAAARARKPIDAALIHAVGNASGGRLADGREFYVSTVRRKSYEVAASQYVQLTVKAKSARGGCAPAIPETF